MYQNCQDSNCGFKNETLPQYNIVTCHQEFVRKLCNQEVHVQPHVEGTACCVFAVHFHLLCSKKNNISKYHIVPFKCLCPNNRHPSFVFKNKNHKPPAKWSALIQIINIKFHKTNVRVD